MERIDIMVRVIVGYSNKLDSIVVDGEPLDISAISDKSVREWFRPTNRRDGWRGLIEEIYSLLADDKAKLSFEFSGAEEVKREFDACLREAGIVNDVAGDSEEKIAQDLFQDAQRAEHRGNYPVALSKYELAARNGHIAGALMTAKYYIQGKGIGKEHDRNKDLYAAYDLLCKIVERKPIGEQDKAIQAEAKVYIGQSLLYGKGVGKDETKALKFLEDAAKEGNAEGACLCGECYEKGIGTEKNILTAIGFYKYSAEQNFHRGLGQLGRCYLGGVEGVEKNIGEAIKLLKSATEQKDPLGECYLGLCYLMGRGVDRDIEKGKKLLEESADAGVSKAQLIMGDIYHAGDIVERSDKTAMRWYAPSAENGNAEAQFKLGMCYYLGQGTERCADKAVEWFRKSAEQEYLDAKGFLGKCYYYGDGIEQNDEAAFENLYSVRNNANGYDELLYLLGKCYYLGKGTRQNYEEAVKWYRKSAEQGNPEAQYCLGDCYMNGIGTLQDYKEACKWYLQSAEQGNCQAEALLGCSYYLGTGVEQNYEEATKWLLKAVQQKDIIPLDSMYYLGKCYLDGMGIEKNVDKGFDWISEAANKEDAKAQCELGNYYERKIGEGEKTKRNNKEKKAWIKEKEELYKNAAIWYQKAAENGLDEGKKLIGVCYILGEGVEKNYEIGAKYIEDAANNGDVWAQNFIGGAYKKGFGVEKNADTSMKWYQKAAENGDGEAHYIIAESLYEVAAKGGGKRLAIAMGLGAIIPVTNMFTIPTALILSKLSMDEKLKKFLETDEGKLMYGHYKSALDLGYMKAEERLKKLNKLIDNKNN